MTVNIYVDCYAAIASKLAPTLVFVGFRVGLLLFQQPLAITRGERRHFIRLGGVHCLENFQLFALARKIQVLPWPFSCSHMLSLPPLIEAQSPARHRA